MKLLDAINSRKSIRGYSSTQVSQDILRKIMETALRAPSSNNIQPWRFVIAAGMPLERLRQQVVNSLYSRPADYATPPLHGAYLERARAVGKELFSCMGISREGKEARQQWNERGYRFFDAPALILIGINDDLDENVYRFDLGCIAQTICLAAMEYGLGTCIEEQAVSYQRDIFACLELPQSFRLVYGIAIGYPDPDFPANSLHTDRVRLEQAVEWRGFSSDIT